MRNIVWLITALAVISFLLHFIPVFFFLRGDLLNALFAWYLIWWFGPHVRVGKTVRE